MIIGQLRRWRQFLLIILAAVTVLWGMVSTAWADSANYSIKSNDITAVINRDGSADVTQQIHYQFYDDHHGVYIVQDTNGLGKISKIEVAREFSDYQKAVKQSKSDQEIFSLKDYVKIKPFFYQVDTDADGGETKGDYRIVAATNNYDDQTIAYRYHLSAVAKRYRDTGEINWKVIGSRWQTPLERVKVKIVLPAVKGEQRVWLHGAKVAHWDKKNARSISFTARNVNQFLEVHMTFPAAVIDQAPLHRQNRLKEVLKIESGLSIREALFSGRTWTSYVFSPLMLIIGFLLILAYWWGSQGKNFRRRDHVLEHLHRFDLPTVSSAEASALYQRNIGDLSGRIPLATEVAELQLQKVLMVNQKNRNNYVLKWNSEFDRSKSPFFYYLTHEVGKNGQITSNKLRHSKRFKVNEWRQMQRKWQAMTRRKIASQDKEALTETFTDYYFLVVVLIALLVTNAFTSRFTIGFVLIQILRTLEIFMFGITILDCVPMKRLQARLLKGNQDSRVSRYLLSYLLGLIACWGIHILGGEIAPFGLSLTMIIQPMMVGVVVTGIVMLGIQKIKLHFLTDYSSQGYQELIEVLQFKQMIHDMGKFEKKDLPDELLWGKYYVYATAVGETKRLIKALDQQFGTTVVDQALREQFNSNSNILEANIDSAITGAIISHAVATEISQIRSSDRNSISDGGSWGSSGGSGGDSGGGAF